MVECLRGELDNFLEEITEKPETPAASNLLTVRGDSKQELLNDTQAQVFHHAVAQLLFTGIQCRKDAQSAIAFLTMRVRKPDEEDWKKLRRLIDYLKRTIKLPLILRADGVNVLKWWVDASYVAHDDMRGHTGGTMSCGQQHDRRETTNIMLARGRSKNIMRRREQGNKNDTVARIRIWINSRVTWEET